MINYEKLMKKCISLAKKGAGNTSPNPMVGCVILNNNEEIISSGYHHKYGENHAERDALLKLKNGEEKGGVLIVNLEPCSHFGKTPPCADLIIERGLKRVVIGCKDNNPKVNGGGILKLKNAGIEVISGVLEKECRKLNEIFFTNMEENRIFTALKTATTIDGKISAASGESKWITSESSRNYSKRLRKLYDAILTSSETVIADNPQMTHKTKIILDRNLRTSVQSNIYKTGSIILAVSENLDISNITPPKNVQFLKCKINNDGIDLNDLYTKLYKLGIKSVFTECGGILSGSLIKNNLVDKIYHFTAPKILNDNNGKSAFNGDNIERISDCRAYHTESFKIIGDDMLVTYSK